MIKKMVFVISALRGGGAEKFVLNLYKAMEKYQGYECHIVSIEKAVEHNIDGYRVHFVSDFCNVSKKGLRRLVYKKNVAKSVDDYICKNISKDAFILSNMLLSDKIMSESKLKVHHVIHNSYKTAFLFGKGFFKKIKIKHKVNRLYRNHPLVFVSKAAESEYNDEFYSPFNNKVIYNPTELSDLQRLSNLTVEDIEDRYLIHIGRFNRQKRHDRLIKAFSRIKNKDIKLLLIGNGTLKPESEKLVSDLGIDDRVIFKGFTENPYPYLKKSEGLTLSSDFEGLPTVLIEAIALNAPIITTDCSGGIREIVGDNENVISPCHDTEKLSSMMDSLILSPDEFQCSFPNKFLASEVSSQYHHLHSLYYNSTRDK
ncbi:glycosyl transferase [Vibrio splendidus]|uniref:glycosyltransferase n=1 Tax=Vibrio splendidus TaxID=29497 RepID=UPI000C864F9B|nr:glycosyltransferase [Vibrio splendidus]MCC5519723.1 glycosyltransferase [Vibrio splendidus]PMO06206.1 glycosyl transferase [Vibrio splendidus]